MYVNFRERVPEVTADHMGNYEEALMFLQKDFQDSSSFRKRLTRMQRSRSEFPGCFDTLRLKAACVSTWATFHRDIPFDDCDLLRFQPLYPVEHLCNNLCIVFKPSSKEISAVVAATCEVHRRFEAH